MTDQIPQQLYTRANIIQSHKLFSSFLNANIVNVFIHLFDNEHTMSLNNNKKINLKRNIKDIHVKFINRDIYT